MKKYNYRKQDKVPPRFKSQSECKKRYVTRKSQFIPTSQPVPTK